MSEPKPVLVLIGPPGAGKTRVGQRVARLLRAPFVDTDRRLVAEHGAIAELFTRYGEPYFRALEREQVSRALTERAVIALGGGSVLDPATQQDLSKQTVVLLTVSREAVAARIGGSKRPLLKNGLADWELLVESRREVYERLATRSWDTSEGSLDGLAADIADWVRRGRKDQDGEEAVQ
ncbi:MAG: shikimate kinase [Microbacteriaceae bacterium]